VSNNLGLSFQGLRSLEFDHPIDIIEISNDRHPRASERQIGLSTYFDKNDGSILKEETFSKRYVFF
jgi:hypothetical protein